MGAATESNSETESNLLVSDNILFDGIKLFSSRNIASEQHSTMMAMEVYIKQLTYSSLLLPVTLCLVSPLDAGYGTLFQLLFSFLPSLIYSLGALF